MAFFLEARHARQLVTSLGLADSYNCVVRLDLLIEPAYHSYQKPLAGGIVQIIMMKRYLTESKRN